jgi:hypothetical protein
VVDASPAGLEHCLHLDAEIVRVRYRFRQLTGRPPMRIVEEAVGGAPGQAN